MNGSTDDAAVGAAQVFAVKAREKPERALMQSLLEIVREVERMLALAELRDGDGACLGE